MKIKHYIELVIVIILSSFLVISNLANAQATSNFWIFQSNEVKPSISTWKLKVPQLGGAGTKCVHVDNTGLFSNAAADCGTGGGGIATSTNPLMATYFVATGTVQASTFPILGVGSSTPFGNLGVVGTTTIKGNLLVTRTGEVPTYNDSNLSLMDIVDNVNSYTFIGLQNKSNSISASSDFVWGNDRTTTSTYYADCGVTSSNYADAIFEILDPNDGYCFSTDGAFKIGTGSTTAASYIGFFTGGYANANEKARITQEGNLGIGTTSPFAALSVNPVAGQASNSFVVGSSTGTQFIINNKGNTGIGTTSPYASLSITNTGTNPSFVVEDSTSPDTTPFIIDASGNVSIGTSTNVSKLDIRPVTFNSSQADGITLGNTTNNGWNSTIFLRSDVNGVSRLSLGGPGGAVPDSLVIVASGNIGIGTTTPSSKLNIYSSTNGDILKLEGFANGTATGLKITNQSGDMAAIRSAYINSAVSTETYLSFYTNPSGGNGQLSTEGMRLTGAGNVGIGTTTPAAKLDIFNTTSSATAPLFSVASSTSGAGTSTAFYINANGNVGIGTTSPYQLLSVAGNVIADTFIATSTTATSTFSGGFSAASSLYVLQNGNVGIGTTLPNDKLTITGNGAALGITTVTLPGTYYARLVANYDSNQPVQLIGAGGTELLRQTYNGTAGLYLMPVGSGFTAIGTSSATSRLTVWGKGTGTGKLFELVNSASTTVAQVLDNGTAYFLGNVGIGSSTPTNKLAITVSNTANVNEGLVLERGSGTNTAGFKLISDSGGLYHGAITYKSSVASEVEAISFGSNASTRAQVGIGTTTPSAKLDVFNTVSTPNAALFSVASSTSGTGTSTALFVAANGFVGIGTSSPLNTLHVSSVNATPLKIERSTAGNSNIAYTSLGTGTFYAGLSDAGAFGIGTSAGLSTAFLTVTSPGNVGIGTTTPQALLSVIGGNLEIGTTTGSTVGNVTIGGARLINTYTPDVPSGQSSNIFVGKNSGNYTMTGTNGQNAGFGGESLVNLTTGTNNASVGFRSSNGITSGQSNSALGGSACRAITTGSSNTCLGNSTGFGFQVPTVSFTTAIGAGAYTNRNNSMVLGGVNGDYTDVALGTTSPWAKFTIQGAVGSTTVLFDIASTTSSLFATSSLFNVTSNGNVGIGTSTPQSGLEIYESIFQPALSIDGGLTGGDIVRMFRGQAGGLAGAASAGMALNVSNSNPQFSFRSGITSQSTGTTNSVIFYDSGRSGLSFATSSVATGSTGLEPLFIKVSTSAIGLGGTTTPWATVSVNGSYQPVGTPTFAIGSSTKTDMVVQQSGRILFPNTGTATGGTNQPACFINATGELIKETTTVCQVSSEKFKHDIKPLTVSALNIIKKIKTVSYSPNTDASFDYDNTQYGFTAEQVASVDPHLAEYGLDGKERTLDDRALLSIAYKAIQEQQKQIDKLKDEIKALKK